MKPYPYQRTCLNALGAARRKGRKRALAVMATGLGKTVVSAFEIKRLLKQAPGRVLYLCHSNHILRQARKTFEEVLGGSYTHGYFHGTEKHLHHVDVLYGSLQTMYKQRKKFKRREFRYVVVDEVHHAHAATFRPTIEYFQPDWMIGLTATPERGDGLDISTLFEGKPVFELGIFKALARRHLCDVDYRIMTDEIQKLEVLDTPVGKLSIAELNRTVFVPKRDKEIARIIRQKAAEEFESPRVMVFCASIEHAERMAKLMPHAAVVHSKLKPKEKDERLDAFRSGKISTILTVDMLNEGIDVPEANVIVFLRSTASRRIFLQQLGRGLRKALGKLKVLVLDFVANCERLEMIDQLQQGVRDALNALPSGPKADGEAGEAQPAFILTLDGVKFDERVWKLLEASRQKHGLYTREVLEAQLLNKARTLGRSPSQKEVEVDPNMAASGTFYRIFQKDTWGEILEAVGLPPVRRRAFSIDKLRAQLLQKAKDLGRTPGVVDINNDPSLPDVRVFFTVFDTDSWNGVLAANELPLNKVASYTIEELTMQLIAKRNSLGRTPSGTEIDADPNMASVSAFRAAFGMTMHGVIKTVLGVHAKGSRHYTKAELTQLLLDKARVLGRTPTGRDLKADPDMPGRGIFLAVFEVDSWPEVLVAIGLTPSLKALAIARRNK